MGLRNISTKKKKIGCKNYYGHTIKQKRTTKIYVNQQKSTSIGRKE